MRPTSNPFTDLARHLAGLFARAEVHVVEGASHLPQRDQPETVAELVKELDKELAT